MTQKRGGKARTNRLVRLFPRYKLESDPLQLLICALWSGSCFIGAMFASEKVYKTTRFKFLTSDQFQDKDCIFDHLLTFWFISSLVCSLLNCFLHVNEVVHHQEVPCICHWLLESVSAPLLCCHLLHVQGSSNTMAELILCSCLLPPLSMFLAPSSLIASGTMSSNLPYFATDG